MALFFGYDPGGFGSQERPKPASGVAAMHIDENGRFENVKTCTVVDAAKALSWFREQPFAMALGVDTLLCWSFRGHRSCDDRLRARYPEAGNSVLSQNSLYSSMTINGVLVAAKAHRELGLPLVESHPKLLIAAEGGHLCRRDDESKALCWAKAGSLLSAQDGSAELIRQYNELLESEDEHRADALVAAWCASRWYFRDSGWTTDLYGVDSHDVDSHDPLYFPAGPAVYPWPEPIALSDG